jgi:integrase
VDWRDSSRHQATFRAEAGSWQRVITDFLRRTGNLKLAQMLAGHADIATANIYAHLDTTDLKTALRAPNEGDT